MVGFSIQKLRLHALTSRKVDKSQNDNEIVPSNYQEVNDGTKYIDDYLGIPDPNNK